MRYYELYGLPGSGKSTISNPVVVQLKQEGFRVASRSDVYFLNCGRKVGKLLVYVEILCEVKMYPIYGNILRFNRKVSSKLSNLKYAFQTIFFLHQILKAYRRNLYDIIILDEGIIQYLSSNSHDFFIEEEHLLLENLFSWLNKILDAKIISCELSVDESIKRIVGRTEHSRRFSSSIPSLLLEEAMSRKKNNLLKISSKFSQKYILDMDLPIEYNINRLIEYIKSSFAV